MKSTFHNSLKNKFMYKVFLVVIAMFMSFTQSQAQSGYVGAAEADNEFGIITAEDMANIQGKKILLCSRSFGLNIEDGLNVLESENSIYAISKNNYSDRLNLVYDDLSDLPDASIFNTYDMYHVLISPSPLTKRIDEFDYMIRNLYHTRIDAAILLYHTADGAMFSEYKTKMDKLKADFPNIKFGYTTSGVSPVEGSSENTKSCDFASQSIAEYKGVEPLYDMKDILSTDEDGVTDCGCQMCPDFNLKFGDPPTGDDTHPNSPFSEKRMGKGFLLLLHKMFNEGTTCTSTLAPTVPNNVAGNALSTTSIQLSWDASTHADCGVKYYKVKRNGTVIGNYSNTSFTDTGLTENTSYTYTVSAISLNNVASSFSTEITIYTLIDVTAPLLVDAIDSKNSESVILEFSEDLDKASAETATNYTIDNGITVISASLDGKFVTLTTSTMADGVTNTVTVNNVKDNSSAMNTIAANSQDSFIFKDRNIGGMTAYWSLDSTTGGIVTDEVGSNDGTLSSPVWISGGKYNGGLEFDGDDKIEVGNGTFGMDVTNEFTFACWVKPTSLGGALFKRGKYIYPLSVELEGGNIKTVIRTGSTNYLTSANKLSTGTWNHVAVSYIDEKQIIYINGVIDAEKNTTGTLVIEAFDAFIGEGLNGSMDEIYFFNEALDSEDVVALMNNTYGEKPVNTDSLAVANLLKANGANWDVSSISVFNSEGRITELHLQTDLGGSLPHITSHIGELTELEILHAYGPDQFDHTGNSQLSIIDPAIALCTKLRELRISDNNLTSLPAEIANLSNITNMSVANNKLCGVSGVVKTWLDTNNPGWEGSQVGCSGTPVISVALNKSTINILVAGTETLLATVNPSDATNKNVTWSSSNNSVSTVSSTGVVTAIAEGNATITVTTEDGSFQSICEIDVSHNLSVEFLSTDVKIFPNPTSNNLHVSFGNSNSKSFRVVLINMSGETVFQDRSNQNKFDIDCSKYPKGVYILKLEDGETELVKKVEIN